MNSHIATALEATAFIRAQKVPGQSKWRRTDEAKSRGDYSFYRGSGGIILLLLELHQSGQDARALAEATAAGEEILTFLDGKDWLSVSPSTGWPGYAFVLGELARATGRKDFATAAATCLDRLMSQATPIGAGLGWIEPMPFSEITGFTGDREIFDQSVGAAGAALVLLDAHAKGLHPEALTWARAVCDRLLEVAEPDPDGLRWRLMSDMPFDFTAPNFAHGGAGVGYLMAQMFRATGEARYLDAACEAARYTLSRSHAVGSGRLVCHTEEATRPMFYLGACHGPAGTGRLLLELHDLTGEARWLADAKSLIEGLLATGAPETRSKGYWNNYGQCCGDAGVGEFALLMAARTGEAVYRELARRCASVIVEASTLDTGTRRWPHAEHRDRPEFLEAQTGYMQGAAGIASFLLHLGTTEMGQAVKITGPDWPKMA